MKKTICWLLLPVLLCACLPAAVSAENELTEVRCGEWRFSVRIPAGLNVFSRTYEDEYAESVICGGLIISAGGRDDLPQVQVMRRSRFYDPCMYLGAFFPDYLERHGNDEPDEYGTYAFGGRILYGNAGVLYGEKGEELFTEFRLIPAGGNRGTEFIVRYASGDEAPALSLLDTVVRYYQPDDKGEEADPRFLPAGYTDKPDLQDGTYLLRVDDADKIETDGYFTAFLYQPDFYSSEDVHAMRPGDTVLIMDRVLTITGIDPHVDDENGSWYEADLFARDHSLAEERFTFTLEPTDDGSAYRPYFGDDNHSATCVGQVRIRVPQPEPVEYGCDSEDGYSLLSADLLGSLGDEPALFGMGWNEYNHRCSFTGGRLARIETWDYPYSPEDVFVPLDD